MDALHVFCRKLRAISSLSAAVFVFFIEANHCWVRSKDLSNHAEKYGPCVVVSEKNIDGQRVPGIWMTAHAKVQMNNHANLFLKQDFMHMLPMKHAFHELVHLENSPDTIVRKFGDQLRMYRQRIYTPTDASKESKVAFTGKGPGMCDDMVMAWEIALWWGANFLNESSVDRFGVKRVNVVMAVHPEYRQLLRQPPEAMLH